MAPIKGDGRLIDRDLLGPANNDFKTLYVRATLTLQEASDAILLLGSDDGITVWANGVFVHENIVARAARLGEDSVPVMLAQGENVFIFRVNNIGGAWRLLARLALRFEDSPAPNGLN